MKCPKCSYLGFETGDRCKNCGYDFSLMGTADARPADYEIHPDAIDDLPIHMIDEIDRHRSWAETPVDLDFAVNLAPLTPVHEEERPVRIVAAPSTDSELPLFTPANDEDDEPLIKLPVAPRAPLAVRRAADTPRLRAVPRAVSKAIPAPVLQFSEDGLDRDGTSGETRETIGKIDRTGRVAAVEPNVARPGAVTAHSGRSGARAAAALIDHAILLGIDVGVVYFTVRMAGLTMNEWRLLPLAPMATFLGLLKVAYFYAFTAVGGQTIGKMAVGTCVVGDNGMPVDATRAMRRTSAGIISFLLLGLGFLPALFGDHRALHDRLAGTRVIRLRSV